MAYLIGPLKNQRKAHTKETGSMDSPKFTSLFVVWAPVLVSRQTTAADESSSSETLVRESSIHRQQSETAAKSNLYRSDCREPCTCCLWLSFSRLRTQTRMHAHLRACTHIHAHTQSLISKCFTTQKKYTHQNKTNCTGIEE